MSLQTRLAALITAIGADIKALKAPADYVRICSTANVSVATNATMPQLVTPFTFGVAPLITGKTTMWNSLNQWINIDKTGRWLIGFEAVFESKAAAQVRAATLLRNGATPRLIEDRGSFVSGINPWLKGSDVMELQAGDFLQLFLSQNSGAAVLAIPVPSSACRMYAYYLGPST